MGEGDSKLGIEKEPSVMEDLFESIIGAIYIDSGNDIKAVISSLDIMLEVGNYLDAKAPPIQSFKNSLQEFCADKKHRLPPPVYKTISESGPDHKKVYERACLIGEKIYGIGKGKNQKLADAAAAEAALRALTKEEKTTSAVYAEKLENSLAKLKEYAQRNKKTTPEFRDLGETENSTESVREYEIECRFDGMQATGTAPDKHTAKAIAADKILKMTKKTVNRRIKPQKARPVSNISSNTKQKQKRRATRRKPESN